MPYFDRVDIVEAHYAFYAEWHEGQFSAKYERLCRIGTYYNPGRFAKGYETLTENGQAIYRRLEDHSKV